MATRTSYSKLFEPIRIGGVEIRNRVAMGAMGNFFLTNVDGSFNQRCVDYYIERARGGVGLIVTGVCKIENEIEPMSPGAIPVISNAFAAPLLELSEAVHALGAKIFVQLTGGFGRVANPAILGGRQPVSASAIPNYWDPSVTCRELRTDEVESLVHAFGDAAAIVAGAGVDGVEIHAVHEGYLMDQFTIALFNRRTDKYGGDLRGRLTYPIEVVQEIKRRVGRHFPVSLRFSVKSQIKDWRQGGLPSETFQERGRDLEEALQAAQILEAAGYDAFNADCGSYDAWYWAHPPTYQEHGVLVPYVAELKKVVQVPVMVAGRMEIPELAERTLQEGKADMITIARGLLTDPDWVHKVQTGRTEHIRPCIGCHEGCLGRIFLSRPLSCAVNPTVGRERLYALEPARHQRKVLVVGGGPAGMEAARAAALRGYEVILFERSDHLGGHLLEAAVPSFKYDLKRLLDWYEVELADQAIDIRLQTQVTPELIDDERPDITIVATGSYSRLPQVPGAELANVATEVDLLLGNATAGDEVVMVGGGMIGCETALWLAQQGKHVTIVEQLPELMEAGQVPVPHANRIMLIDMLRQQGVDVATDAYLAEITPDGVTVTAGDFHTTTIPAETVGISIGLEPDRELYHSLQGSLPSVYLVGDAQGVRNVMGAVWDGYEVARGI
ncbi:MAG: FAD-dependent oxidoreductase [Chloroflexota bacterium]|nr:FAD-dependent oxidoreductase [Chloroflexota bacterium]